MYDLKLNETMETDDFYITRVPGGWIYSYNWMKSRPDLFVPYSDEFKK